ncbi:outer membrane protein assembly factor BamE [Loktanella sp. M215]|uniref:outer membrane protein assembly factor BamE n=1 Tax=Loktanella sp. M215 TaxID=2675431 RepID=UPI001F01C75A|nr:outer membrane protein assembly factor BamE [Loktanella sp. M215]MBU2360500.1 outer membrane protein assembly factor BamE [Alphaproteobacteria bacterium]MCF7700476.1 outer membrane protein assembly factor BamE [Loktanella sp. M215]
MTDSITKGLRSLIMVGGLALTMACTPIVRNYGYVPTPDDLAQITVGQDTRDSVTTLIGPPTTTGMLGTDAYFYVQSRFETVGARAPVEVDRQVLAVSFASDGTVSNVEQFGLQDGRVIALSRRVTTDNVRDSTFLRQLLGSVGRFNAGDFLGESGGAP